MGKVGAIVVWLAAAVLLSIAITAIVEDFREVLAWWLFGGLAVPFAVGRVIFWLALTIGAGMLGWRLWTRGGSDR